MNVGALSNVYSKRNINIYTNDMFIMSIMVRDILKTF